MKFRKNKNSSTNDRTKKADKQRVYTYYTASRKQIDQFEKTNTARQSNIKDSVLPQRIVFVLASLIALLLIGFTMFISANASIKIEGEKNYNSADYYSKTVNEVIESDVSNRFKPTVKTEDIQEALEGRIPESSAVKVHTNAIGRGVYVTITTIDPFAVLVQQDAPSYVIDAKGKAVVDINITNIDTARLSTVINETGLQYNLGDQLFKPEEMQAMVDLHYQYTKGDITKQITYVLPDTPREVNVKDAGYIVKYGLDDSAGADITQQYGAMVAIKNQLSKQGSAPKEYIDARLGDKVFVK